jgi:hypothetical protein
MGDESKGAAVVFLPQFGYGIYISRYLSNFPYFLTMAGLDPIGAKIRVAVVNRL